VASRINPNAIMTLLVLIIFTLAFAGLFWSQTSDVNLIAEPTPEGKPSKIEQARAQYRDKQNRIIVAQAQIDQQQKLLEQLDREGDIYRLYYYDGNLYGGVANLDVTQAEIKGVMTPLKESNWKLTSELITDDVKYMEGLKTEYAGPDRQTFPSLDDAIHNRQDETKAVLKIIQTQDATFSADKDALQAKLDALSAERDKVDKNARVDQSLRKSEINKREDEISKLLELDLHWLIEKDDKGDITGNAGLEPQGNVMNVETQAGKLIIDQGAIDHIFPGLLFEVFNYQRGAYIDKGRVEVIEVQDRISVCRILSQTDSRSDPIGRGDYIGNPVFNSQKPKVFVVSGEFKRYNKEDLEGFIIRTGGVVWPKLAPGADYLVAGDRSEHAQADARQYQILAMTEDDLLEFVQTTFPPTSDK